MKQSQLADLLSSAITSKLPILIKGAPGIGKTDIVIQACTAANADLIISHPIVDDPIDYKGMPAVKDNCAEFLPFGTLRKLIAAKRPTVYFMDDLGQAPPAVQAAAMQLILARRINGHNVSDHVTFIAVTNRKSDKAGVAGILEPVKSRFASIVELEPDADDWIGWALDNKIPTELIAFIRFRPNLLFDFKPTSDMENCPSPRTIHNVAKLMMLGLSKELEFEAYAGAAGQGFASEFLGFLNIYRQLTNPDMVLLDPDSAEVPSDPATLYAICGALSQKACEQTIGRLTRYAERLPDEFSVLLITDAAKKDPTVINTRPYIKWAARHNHVMV